MSSLLEQLRAALAGRYDVHSEVARGGMAIVFAATDVKHARTVALKVLRPELAVDLAADRFLREIRISAGLNHPHVLALYDSGEAGGHLYYVTPFSEDPTLRARIDRDGPLAFEDVVAITRGVALALAYSHSRGVIHRDIKPDNILLNGNEAIVADFGIARAVAEAGDARLTHSGLAIGTADYMAPEQAFGDADARTDIYSLGCTVYEMIAGLSLAQARSDAATRQLPRRALPSIRNLRRDVPRALERLVARAMAIDADDRFQTVEEFLTDLADASAEVVTTGRSPLRLAAATLRRPRALAGAIAVTAVITWAVTRPRVPDPSDATVAVFPFAITGPVDTSLVTPYSLVDLMYARLTGDPGPHAVPPRLVAAALPGVVAAADAERLRGIARQLGAGRMVVSRARGDRDSIELSANVYDVRSGRLLHPLRAAGRADALLRVVDDFAKELLIRGVGEGTRSLQDLLSHELSAIRPYLRGSERYRRGEYVAAMADYQSALDQDSTFALAAIELSNASAMAGNHAANLSALGRAWRFRSRLSVRDSLYLMLVAGSRYPLATGSADHFRGWDEFGAKVPDRWEVSYFLGDRLFHEGGYVAAPEATQRARNAFQRVYAVDSTIAPVLEHLLDLAILAGDSADVRHLAGKYLAQYPAADNAPYVRWRRAMFFADSAGLVRVRAEFARARTNALTRLAAAAQLEGVGLGDAVRASTEVLRRAVETDDLWIAYWGHRSLLLNMGRPMNAVRWTMDTPPAYGVPVDPLLRAIEAMFLNGDTAVAARAVRAQESGATTAMSAGAPINIAQAYQVCATSLWNSRSGRTEEVERGVRALRSLPRPTERTATTFVAICADMLDAGLAAQLRRVDAAQAIDRLDSLMRAGPTTNPTIRAGAALLLARLFEARGETQRALHAVRRRVYAMDIQGTDGLAELLRREGQLAAAVGDTTGAIRALRQFLALRLDPEPQLLPDTDAARALLGSMSREGVATRR